MALKKQHFAEGEIPIFDEACIYKRGEYWQFRMWLPKENKYARKSLRTRSEATAIEKGKAAYLEIYANLHQGKTYFSIIAKEVKRFCKEFGFTAGMLKGSLAEGRKKQ